MLKRIAILLLLGLLPSCVFGPAPYEITVDALAAREGVGATTYVLAPGNPGVSAEDLQYQEYARLLDRALQAQGYSAAQSQQNAELTIVLSYGVHGPFTQTESYSRPTWGHVGFRRIYHDVPRCDRVPGSRASYSLAPTYGVTGYSTGSFSVTTYSQYTTIEAFHSTDFEQPSSSVVLWRVDLTNVGESSDLRQGFPVMLAAAMPYIGSNSGQKLELELDEDDDAVQFLKGIALR